ncbi:MAG TPA: sugar phosphate isomerase/epimerase family protein [Chthonomonadaceae bacterium]|nr:sugar phosphate isomerase/epimerase family protein [Chthonomonadaceae bacterium]
MEIGVITGLRENGDCFAHVSQFGLHVCQLACGRMELANREVAERVVKAAKEADVRVCAVWGGLPGPSEWNFVKGPITLGLVPEVYRKERVEALKRWADFAVWIGAPAVITHCGFIPENLTDPEFPPVVEAIREVAEYCAARKLEFWFETGQETPVVLLRTIQKVGTSNLGINLDPANLILYGKGNPIDALDVIGPYVRNIHVKDGLYPTDGERLGQEVPPGQGKVRFPEFMARLKAMGYQGELIIEREISGEQQIRDIRQTVADLQRWLEA